MSGDFSLQFDTVPLKTKRGENVLVTRSAPETRKPMEQAMSKSRWGKYTILCASCKPVVVGAL